MHMLDQWAQTPVFEPTDPTQKKIEKYTGIPGAYSSFYFNRVPVQGQLKGPFSTGIATGAGLALGLALAGLGFGVARFAIAKVRRKPLHGLAGWRRLFTRKHRKRHRRH